MDNQLLLPALKHKIVGHFKSHNFRNGNENISNYIQQLDIKYRANDNNDYLQYTQKIRERIGEISRVLNNLEGNLIRLYNNEPQLLIESEINVALSNITSVDFLKDLLFFFEPINYNFDDIYERLEALEQKNST